MVEDKKRKPSRDFPAHAQVPVGKVHPNGVSSKVRVELNTSAPSVPPMHDPFHILNFDGDDTSSRPMPRTGSVMSVDSVSSVLSVDDSFQFTGDGEEDEEDVTKLPKDQRPAQPADEREYFERMWAENFKNSEAQVNSTTGYLPVGAAGRLNRIKGFSFARDQVSHKLYAVFRLEIECIVSEKQWTIYRRFHDFKQLAHQLKNESVRVSAVPTRTLMRSLDPNFLRKRQLELDRWLREVLMLISLENCKVDTDRYNECCGNRGFHASVRLIRHFLTLKANEPPVFEESAASSSSGSNVLSNSSSGFSFSNSGSGRPPLFSTSEQKTDSESMSYEVEEGGGSSRGRRIRVGSADQVSTSSRGGRIRVDSADSNSSRGGRARGASADHVSSSRGERARVKSLPKQEPMGDGREAPFNASTVAEQRRSVILQDVDDEEDDYDEHSSRRGSNKVSLKQFDVLRMIGKGSFGKVLLVQPLYRPCQYTDPIDAANFEEEFTKLPLTQIDSAGLSVATNELQEKSGNDEASGRDPADNVTAAAEAAGIGVGMPNGIAGSTGTSISSSQRNSTLRNLSYTFAGFTYDGTNPSIARSGSFAQSSRSSYMNDE
ncbi:hypothetical protein PC118_g18209 [Phytophthora cactorum]|uniref:PX domain-containing protein n=1 Tax=Phytophthora cactorum TaxID=29920 RepID=A0A8T1FDP9_9STRA|nr:hypothetical protein PC113_g16447 [Phytophthora cactorum]KAG2968132.1 hypothetical protein PC118_g18209 [Phytophthora cactorum]KAG2970584.1 hypothetical protein PC119_g23617 [Phytophthora cactorum]